MDNGYSLTLKHPSLKANFISKLLFLWIIPFVKKGLKQSYKPSDLYENLPSHDSEKLTNKLETNWNKELLRAKKNKCKPRLIRVLIRTFCWRYIATEFSVFVHHGLIRTFQPFIIVLFIKLYLEPVPDLPKMYCLASAIVILYIINVILWHVNEHKLLAISMQMKIAISSLIYRKSLKLSRKSLNQTNIGQIVNILSNDLNRIDILITDVRFCWITIFQICVTTPLIYYSLGNVAFVGVSILISVIPMQICLSRLIKKNREYIANLTDQKVKLINEIIKGIRVIKMYGWEKPFENVVNDIRNKEIIKVTKALYLRIPFYCVQILIERITVLAAVIFYALEGNLLTSQVVFALVQYYSILKFSVALKLTNFLNYAAESFSIIQRIESFLNFEEKSTIHLQNNQSSEIIIKDVCAAWNENNLTLKNLNIIIPNGSLCAIVGSVGSGKSSILQLLLGEMPVKSASISIGKNISYAAQQSWLFSSTIKNNILFGNEYNEQIYSEVVKVCALEEDICQFPYGNESLVGERGLCLSGGQKARINLARCVYRRADIYLLDDPLSAVDAQVGKKLFEQCICKYLCGKTRVLITHQLQYLKHVDIILVINEGQIQAKGTYEDLCKQNIDYINHLANCNQEKKENRELVRSTSNAHLQNDKSEKIKIQQLNEEEMGSKSSRPFFDYLKAVKSWFNILTLLIGLLLTQVFCSLSDYWIKFWVKQDEYRVESPELNLLNDSNATLHYYQYNHWYDTWTEKLLSKDNSIITLLRRDITIYIYALFIFLALAVCIVRTLAIFKSAMTASKNLHRQMFTAVINTTVHFFDTNTSGRILNRFCNDMGKVDECFILALLFACQLFFLVCGILVVVTVTNWYLIFIVLVTAVVFLKVLLYSLDAAKCVKHLEEITKSPVFSHMSSTLEGLTTIRAAKIENILVSQFDHHQNIHTSAAYLVLTTKSFFCLWLDFLSVVIIAATIYSFIILIKYNKVDGSQVGLGVTQVLLFSGILQFSIKQLSETFTLLTNIERIVQYTKLENEEDPTKIRAEPLPSSWPNAGLIEFQNSSLRYSLDNPEVLKNLTFSIQPRQKIGIVGRTGAGKTSLIAALFRLAILEGNILIDNIDTKTIPLNELRKRISIIPQDPVLFSASIKYNLDPFNEFEESKLWKALEEVELKNSVPSLNFMVSDNGNNFSLGQKQLICLARAILRDNKILVLDEATANVDPQTDALIQKTVRNKFATCTVLTVAHRLNTIMDSDKVVVMSGGSMIEYDHPFLLLRNPQSVFNKLVNETGPTMARHLKNLAKQSYLSNY